MEEQRGGFLGWLIGVVAFLILILLLFFFTPFAMFITIPIQMAGIHRKEQKLQRPEIYIPLATNLALYCQSADELQLTNTIGTPRLPQPLPTLGSPWAMFDTNYAHIEFGGGFYHYGYRIRLDEQASTPKTNIWELYFHRENPPDTLLYRLAVAANARVPASLYTSNTVAEYNRRLAKDPNDLGLHKGKIAFLLAHDRTQVRSACLEAVKDLPNHWWPRLTVAIIDTGDGHSVEAADGFTKFVQSQPSFSRYLYLAYFYELTGKPDNAAEAIDKALAYPIRDLDDDLNNSECRGYSIGVYAFQNRKYATVIKLCDALLPIQENGNYAKKALSSLKSAAESAGSGQNPNFSPSDEILGFNAYEKIDVRALLTR